MIMAIALLLVAAGTAYRKAGVIADWYASFAAEHLPPAASSFAPASTSTGAFFYCARQVARRMGELSVETFPSQEESRLIGLGPDSYRIESSVEQSKSGGGHTRIGFVCTTHFDHGRWVLDKLEM